MSDETWPIIVDKELERVWEAAQYKKLMHVERDSLGRPTLVFEDGTRVSACESIEGIVYLEATRP